MAVKNKQEKRKNWETIVSFSLKNNLKLKERLMVSGSVDKKN